MIDTAAIEIQKTSQSRISELDENNIPFAKIYSDHMFVADYYDGEWKDLRITPYENISISPANTAIHYGISIFERRLQHNLFSIETKKESLYGF